MTFLPDSECHHMEICSHTEGCRKDDVLMSYLLIPAVSSLTLPPPLPFPWTANVIAFQQHCEEPSPSATLESLQRAKSWLCASNYLVFSLEKKEGNTNQGTDAARLSSWNEARIPLAIGLPRLSCQHSAGQRKPVATMSLVLLFCLAVQLVSLSLLPSCLSHYLAPSKQYNSQCKMDSPMLHSSPVFHEELYNLRMHKVGMQANRVLQHHSHQLPLKHGQATFASHSS